MKRTAAGIRALLRVAVVYHGNRSIVSANGNIRLIIIARFKTSKPQAMAGALKYRMPPVAGIMARESTRCRRRGGVA